MANFIHSVRRRPNAGGGPGIQIVGWASAQSDSANFQNSLGTLTGGIGGSVQTGDLLIAFSFAATSNVNIDMDVLDSGGVSLGWTEKYDDYRNDSNDSNFGIHWTIAGSSPPSSVYHPGSTNTGWAALGLVGVFRGVNQTTPFDVADVPSGGLNSAIVDPGLITPVTAGALIIAGGGCAFGATAITLNGPANMDAMQSVTRAESSRGAFLGIATKTWTSGDFNPDVMSIVNPGVDDPGNSWSGFTMALRPA